MNPTPIVFLLLAIAGMIVFFAIIASRERARAQAIQIREAFRELNLEYQERGDTEFRAAWAAVPGLPKRGDVRHIGFGEYRSLPVTAFRHRYTVSNGQSSSTIVHWVLSTDTPHWPSVHLRKRSGIGRLLGQRSRISGDEEFDRAWVVTTQSPAFATEALTPRVRALLMRPKQEFSRRAEPQWRFISGKLCLIVRADIKPAQLRAALDTLVDMWEALAPA